MACIMKHVVRTGVIGALAIGGAVLIAGPDRVGALFTQTRDGINHKIDKHITDPTALRAQLRDLEAQYPKRIGDVKGDLAELRQQKSAMERELAETTLASRLADEDREQLLAQIERAQSRRVETVAMGDPVQVLIVFRSERLDVETAQTKTDQIAAKRGAFAGKAVEVQKNLDLLTKQEQRLVSILSKLETERTSFQAQLWTIDQEVDTIARNDRMIEIVSKWQKSIDEQSRYKAGSLDQVRARLADVRARQEAKLDSYAASADQDSYEQRAKIELDKESAAAKGVEPAPKPVARPSRQVIEILPEKAPAAAPSGISAGSVVSNTPAR